MNDTFITKFGSNCSYGIFVYVNDVRDHIITRQTLSDICIPTFLSRTNYLEDLLLNKVSPYVIFIMACTNTLVCIVLSREAMISPTNIILLAIAISDMLTGLFPFPIYIMRGLLGTSKQSTINTMRAYVEFYLSSIFPTTFHTSSTWLTIVLAFQRVIYVKCPTLVSTLCTNKISVITSMFTFLLAIVMHSINYSISFEKYFEVCVKREPKYVQVGFLMKSLNPENVTEFQQLMKCTLVGDTAMFLYNSLRIILLHVIPCILLTILTIVILIVLRKKAVLIKKLRPKQTCTASTTNGKEETEALNVDEQDQDKQTKTKSKNNRDSSSSTSKMLVVVLITFLLVEIPIGVVITLYAALKYIQHPVNEKLWYDMTTACNFIILVSYPFNFVIYCIMSKKFRDTFRTTLMIKRR